MGVLDPSVYKIMNVPERLTHEGKLRREGQCDCACYLVTSASESLMIFKVGGLRNKSKNKWR